MVANILPAAPSPRPWNQNVKFNFRQPPSPRPWGSKDWKATFLEHDHVAYQIKGNHECSNMVANILPAAPLSPQKVKVQLFLNMAMVHIKGIVNAATW